MTVKELRDHLRYMDDHVVIKIQDPAGREYEAGRVELDSETEIVECGGQAPPIGVRVDYMTFVPEGY